ncbi:phage tail spike protein [Clostridium gasigenes]|uniref:phage tail spike protein n=1 Tax=Clostridium gasigenes TaxID=94869 RepID=UPI001C0A96A8|nr:phage tail spike protein [Clostridium gasigenes]MBU3107133.1 phage tail protein [Clostridium gasigenes]
MTTKKVKIAIFPPKTSRDAVLSSNGLALDNICIKYNSDEELSSTGDYTLDATFLLDETGLYKNIVDEAILKVVIDGEDEVFRIVKNNQTTREITIVAKQITITEQKQLWLDDVRPTNIAGQESILDMYNNAVGVKEIFVYSDIPIVSTAYYQLINMYKACHDCDQSFTNRWGSNGLETTRRKYNLYLNAKRGKQSKLSIRERKNLTGFEASTNVETFVTRAIGKGFNGIKGQYIESSLKDKYARVNTHVFEYPDIKIKTAEYKAGDEGTWFDTEAQAMAELDKRVGLEFTENHVDEIKATYDINFVSLEKTEEYKEYSYLEKANVGDTVKVYVPTLDVDITVRVTRKKFNGLTQRVDSMVLSNASTTTVISTTKIINDLKNQYGETGNNNINDYINAIIQAGMKDSNVIVRNGELLIMDTKDINTARNVWRWNAGALVHSSEGYYSKNWNIGITQDGTINAQLLIGKLLANGEGTNYFDLDNGIIKGKDLKIDLTNGEVNFKNGLIEGKDLKIDLGNGIVDFRRGLIRGDNSSWNLDTGVFESIQTNGDKIVISPSEGFYRQVGSNKNVYHSLIHTISITKTFNAVAYDSSTYQTNEYFFEEIPVEFYNKKVSVLVNLEHIFSSEYVLTQDAPVIWGVIENNKLKIFFGTTTRPIKTVATGGEMWVAYSSKPHTTRITVTATLIA